MPHSCVSFVLHLREHKKLSKIFISYQFVQEYHAKDISVNFYGFTEIKLVAASGRICVNGSTFENSHTRIETIYQKLIRVYVLWRFNLDPKLRLNITFKSLHFITNWNNPQKGNVKLCGVKCTANKTLFSDHGIHPSFPVYPDLQDLAIQLEFISQARTNFSIKVLYSIMDRKVLAMYPKERKQHWSTAALFFHQNVVALTYHVQVEKSTLLLLQNLNITEILGIVHDGPGFLSPVLELKSSSLKLSSFQCILQLLASSMSRTESFVSIRSIVSKATIIKAITQTESFLFSSSSCQNNPCVLHLKSSSNTQTKVTIKHFQYHSEEIMNCNFGAMVISNKPNHWYCQLYNANLDPPDFYSKNPNFIIVIYWYKFYTFIKTIILAIEAKCKAVQLDFCIHILCEKQSVFCYQYLNDALNGSSVLLQTWFIPLQVQTSGFAWLCCLVHGGSDELQTEGTHLFHSATKTDRQCNISPPIVFLQDVNVVHQLQCRKNKICFQQSLHQKNQISWKGRFHMCPKKKKEHTPLLTESSVEEDTEKFLIFSLQQ